MPSLPSGTDKSGTTIVGAVTVAAASPYRQSLTFQNTSDTEMRVTENGTAASASTGYVVPAGYPVNISTNRAVSVYCAVAGKTFAATET